LNWWGNTVYTTSEVLPSYRLDQYSDILPSCRLSPNTAAYDASRGLIVTLPPMHLPFLSLLRYVKACSIFDHLSSSVQAFPRPFLTRFLLPFRSPFPPPPPFFPSASINPSSPCCHDTNDTEQISVSALIPQHPFIIPRDSSAKSLPLPLFPRRW
jgi:hypothetical protein